MRGHEPVAGTAVVKLPAEVDITNAEQVGEQLRAAAAPGVMVVVANLTTTALSDFERFMDAIREIDNFFVTVAQLPGN